MGCTPIEDAHDVTYLEGRCDVAESMGALLAVLNTASCPGEILTYISTQAMRVLGAQACVLFQYDAASAALTIQASTGLPDAVPDGTTVSVDASEAGSQWLPIDDEPHAITDIPTYMALDGDVPGVVHTHDLEGQFGAYLGVPLPVDDVPGHVLGLLYRWPRAFHTEYVELAAAYGRQAGLALQNAYRQQAAEQAAVTAERNRIARDLHDSVTQTLFSASLIADVLPTIWEQDQVESQAQVDELRQLTRGALAEMRTLLMELRPETLVKAPLRETLGHLVNASGVRAGIPIDLVLPENLTLPPEVKVALYRIAQEALNNVAKHADAGTASVRVHRKLGTLVMQVDDDGVGFDVDAVSACSLGLGIMRERAEAVGARLRVRTRPGQGTRITTLWQPNTHNRQD